MTIAVSAVFLEDLIHQRRFRHMPIFTPKPLASSSLAIRLEAPERGAVETFVYPETSLGILTNLYEDSLALSKDTLGIKVSSKRASLTRHGQLQV